MDGQKSAEAIVVGLFRRRAESVEAIVPTFSLSLADASLRGPEVGSSGRNPQGKTGRL